MYNDFETCPSCGQKYYKGAMRCTKCGKLLITPEEQLERIQKVREAKKPFPVGRLFKLVLYLIIIGVVYYYFSDQIIEFVRKLLGR